MYLGDNCIQNFHLGRYIVGYTVRNLVLNMVIPILMHLVLQFCHKLERCKQHKAARHLTKCDIISDVKLFVTVYHRIYCR